MGSDWTLKKIGEFAEVKGGKRLPKGKRLSEKKTNHPYIRVVDFTDGRISLSNLLYVPEEVFPNIKRYVVESGEVVISIVGTIGLVATIPFELHEANLTENAAKILIEDTTIDPQFLSWFLKSSIGQHEIQRNTVGSTQPKLPLYGIKNIEVSYPPLPEQRAISHILGSLDDKIEVNRRMNETLEATARAIFKSWFVDFDPVRAKAEGRPTGLPDDITALFPDSFEDSEMGEIPKGWEVVPLPEIIEVNPARTLKKGQIAPYLEMKNMPENSARALDWYDREFGSGIKFINGDTLMARITPCLENGKGAFVDFLENGQVGWGSTEYIVFRAAKPLPLEYSYFLSRTKDLRSHAIVNMIGSSGRQRVPASIFDSYLVVKPSEEVAEYFGMISAPIMQKIKKNDEETRTLAALRDTLLPKLISGELRVPDAEKFVEEAGL